MLNQDQRRLLGEFIRAHRERKRPLAGSGRRRTPGLRREELAAQSGISATWCAWIEQGRPVQASAEVLGRLAEALSLTRPERAYLFELAGRLDPEATNEIAEEAPTSLAAAVRTTRVPAYGLDRLWNACCWNAEAGDLFRGWLDGDNQRNLLRFVFLEESARKLIPDWQERSRRLLAEFRADFGHLFRDPQVANFIVSLRQASPLFARTWDHQDVQHRIGGERLFVHPERGPLRFEQHAFTLAERTDYKLVLLTPT